MNNESIRIVLVATTHPGNIGSAARAMKTMGLSQLYLVSPKKFPHVQATELSAGADDILSLAKVTDSLVEALHGCHLVIGTSARSRGLDIPCLNPHSCAQLVSESSRNRGSQVAIVFGREHAGLTNDELLQCHYHVTIPTIQSFSSLNIAQAVQIIAYELRTCSISLESSSDMSLTSPDVENSMKNKQLATHDQVENFYIHLQELLVSIDFLKISNPRRMFQRLRRLFNRLQLEHIEVQILRGILSNIQRALAKKDAHVEG